MAITAKQRTAIYRRDGNRCLLCGANGYLTLDHIVPRSRGGDDSDGNLQTLCEPCNSAKGSTHVADYRGMPFVAHFGIVTGAMPRTKIQRARRTYGAAPLTIGNVARLTAMD